MKDALIATVAVPPAVTFGLPTETVVIESEAAHMLRLSLSTVRRLRLSGDGPKFVMLGHRRIGYTVGDLRDWIRARTIASTSEAA